MGSALPLDRTQHFTHQVPQPPEQAALSRHSHGAAPLLCSFLEADI
jgi:hypothetical protein